MKEKKKHPFRWLWVTPLVIIGILGILVGAVYACFYDNSIQQLNVNNETELEEIVNRSIVDSVTLTEEDEKISITLDEDDLNQLLHNAYLEMDENVKQYIKQIYVDVENNKFTFYVSVSVPMMQTKLGIETTIKEENDEIYFNITNLKLGRIGGLFDFAKTILPNVINDDLFNNLFSQTGLSIKSDITNKRLIYSEDDVISDIKKLAGSNGDMEVFVPFIDTFKTNNLIDLDFENYNGIALLIDIKPLENNELYDFCLSEDHLDLDIMKYREDITKLVNNDVIAATYIDDCLSYLIHGYQDIDEGEFKTLLEANPKLLSSIGINNALTYVGLNLPHGVKISDSFEQYMSENYANLQHSIANNENCTLTLVDEKDIDNFLKSSPCIGYTTSLYYLNENNEYVVNFICITDLYCNIVNDSLYFIIDISFNGCLTKIILDMEILDFTNTEFTLHAKNILYGTKNIEEHLVDYVFDLLNQAFKKDNTTSIDTSNKSITINYSNALIESGIQNLLNAVGQYEIQTKLIGETLQEHGKIILSL